MLCRQQPAFDNQGMATVQVTGPGAAASAAQVALCATFRPAAAFKMRSRRLSWGPCVTPSATVRLLALIDIPPGFVAPGISSESALGMMILKSTWAAACNRRAPASSAPTCDSAAHSNGSSNAAGLIERRSHAGHFKI
jgi:hypothetical protein